MLKQRHQRCFLEKVLPAGASINLDRLRRNQILRNCPALFGDLALEPLAERPFSEQVAEVVATKPRSLDALSNIDGVGQARLNAWGAELLAVLSTAIEASDA